MTNPRTPREDQVQSIVDTLSTEQGETITSASGAVDRQAVIIADLQTSLAGAKADSVTAEVLAGWQDRANALKEGSDAAQAGFDKIGVPDVPQPPIEEILARSRKAKGRR